MQTVISFVLRDGSVGSEGIYFGVSKAQILAPLAKSVIVATVVVIPLGKTPLLSAVYAPIALRIATISLFRFALFALPNCFAGSIAIVRIEKRIDNTPITRRISIRVNPLLL